MDINKYIKKKGNDRNSRESLESSYENYTKMSQEQLMDEMFRTAEAARKTGTLNDEMLDKFYSNAQSFLAPEQAERMRELIIELKK